MLMLMDAGNSRVKWAWLEAGLLGEVTATPYNDSDKCGWVSQLLTVMKPDKLIIVHVLGVVFEREILKYCNKLQIECDVVSSTVSCYGVSNAYEIPESLGADRFVGLVAAHHLFPKKNSIIIDAGTAVTIDAITATGQHLGGVILPGLQLWADALIKNTQLQPISDCNYPELFANNTKKGIDSGRLYGLSGAIIHLCQLMEESFKQPVQRILCGGDSTLLADYLLGDNMKSNKRKNNNKLQVKYEVVPELVMRGLKIIGEVGEKNA